ncbi:DUF2075 domain-containing protein [Nocardia huaxiensis]|uniref:DUF2075 domain-containing protein n=1 Tax=Nocardia huaxiensis TaxID=2755382 RepID=A0A7D6VF17_9NOCA|nr:DNA/RNA helicase domain-containing protein [Nocardia huaxiensis]QLY33493.1 DUF2075 domain-containing protein [Nocardia huaxiensis]
MALMRGSARRLWELADANRLPIQLLERAATEWDRQPSPGEVRSWKNSLHRFLGDVVEAGLGDIEVLLEHRLPHSPKRVDVILCGVHPETRVSSFVLVELKQWSEAERLTRDLVRVSFYDDPVLHPIAQVHEYCRYLVDFTPDLERHDCLVLGIAYLHNALPEMGRSLMRDPRDHESLFTHGDTDRMRALLCSLLDGGVDSGAARRVADAFLQFDHRPSKKLLDLAAEEIESRELFVLLDEQRVAYEMVAAAVNRAWEASRAQRKNVEVSFQRTAVIVVGGPGSGKSVIALSLMGHLARGGYAVTHATGSRAFTKTMQKALGEKSSRGRSLFKFFSDYSDAKSGDVDVLICDEAHRIRTTDDAQLTDSERRRGRRNQLYELVTAAAVPVFFLDDNQVVRPGEAGSLATIKEGAEGAGLRVDVVNLRSQFRCGGSDLFERWVDRLLGVIDEPPLSWSQSSAGIDDAYVVGSAGSPGELEAWVLAGQGQGPGAARMSAGYCWDWSRRPTGSGANRRLVADVQIGGWRRPWNARPGANVPGVPDSDFWASDPAGVGQVGCIYTAQGFEYDWAGVIFGPDLVRRGGTWVADRSSSFDGAVKRADVATFPDLIRNTYKVLLTRGMRGVRLFSTDPETQAFLVRMTS